ncbi:MAG: SDR family oxidoreductase [Ignavibacteriaceae bacterium]|nr:SDR family oxidoreductase [Ignavibacteriaceae bacterium]
MNNKTCLITGATSGIGKSTAIALAKLGFILILTARSDDKGFELVNKLQKKYKVQAEFIKTDISSLKEVKQLSEQIKQKYGRIDVLINNAGSRFADYKKSVDGIELTFATNHLGHFYLTLLLIDLLKKSSSARIINVSSSAHLGKSIDFENIANPKNYERREAYGQSKLANVLFTYALARQLIKSEITVNALDPGGVASNLGRNDGLISWTKHIGYYLVKRELLTPKQGAATSVYLTSSPKVAGVTGKYFYLKKEKKSSPESYDEEAAKKLWDLSLKICGMEDQTI